MKYERTPLLTWKMLNFYVEDGQCMQETNKYSAAGNWTFWKRFVNIENLLNGTVDLYKIWWQ